MIVPPAWLNLIAATAISLTVMVTTSSAIASTTDLRKNPGACSSYMTRASKVPKENLHRANGYVGKQSSEQIRRPLYSGHSWRSRPLSALQHSHVGSLLESVARLRGSLMFSQRHPFHRPLNAPLRISQHGYETSSEDKPPGYSLSLKGLDFHPSRSLRTLGYLRKCQCQIRSNRIQRFVRLANTYRNM